MKKILAILLVLAFGVFARAQYFDMQRGTDVIRPDITNELSHLGAAYTLGSDPGNLTGDYGNYFVLRMIPSPSPEAADFWIDMTTYNKFDEIVAQETLKLGIGIRSTLGLILDYDMIITADKMMVHIGIPVDFVMLDNSNMFDRLGGYVDYVAISGEKNITISSGFQFGNGWINDQDEYDFVDMQRIRVPGIVIFNPFTFGDPGYTLTSTKALAWNTETGVAMRGAFSTGGNMGLQGWNHLTFTFGSFERHPVPEPATLVILGVAAAGIPVVRRWRRG